MTPKDLRQAAATLTGEARGRLLERADVVEYLLASIGEEPGKWSPEHSLYRHMVVRDILGGTHAQRDIDPGPTPFPQARGLIRKFLGMPVWRQRRLLREVGAPDMENYRPGDIHLTLKALSVDQKRRLLQDIEAAK